MSTSPPLDPNGKDPLVGRSAEWAPDETSDGTRSSERRRVRRRTRVVSATRAKIRLRVGLACIGALLVILVGVYLVVAHAG